MDMFSISDASQLLRIETSSSTGRASKCGGSTELLMPACGVDLAVTSASDLVKDELTAPMLAK